MVKRECGPGRERHKVTNKCIKSLKECETWQERNPETNRCRKKPGSRPARKTTSTKEDKDAKRRTNSGDTKLDDEIHKVPTPVKSPTEIKSRTKTIPTPAIRTKRARDETAVPQRDQNQYPGKVSPLTTKKNTDTSEHQNKPKKRDTPKHETKKPDTSEHKNQQKRKKPGTPEQQKRQKADTSEHQNKTKTPGTPEHKNQQKRKKADTLEHDDDEHRSDPSSEYIDKVASDDEEQSNDMSGTKVRKQGDSANQRNTERVLTSQSETTAALVTVEKFIALQSARAKIHVELPDVHNYIACHHIGLRSPSEVNTIYKLHMAQEGMPEKRLYEKRKEAFDAYTEAYPHLFSTSFDDLLMIMEYLVFHHMLVRALIPVNVRPKQPRDKLEEMRKHFHTKMQLINFLIYNDFLTDFVLAFVVGGLRTNDIDIVLGQEALLEVVRVIYELQALSRGLMQAAEDHRLEHNEGQKDKKLVEVLQRLKSNKEDPMFTNFTDLTRIARYNIPFGRVMLREAFSHLDPDDRAYFMLGSIGIKLQRANPPAIDAAFDWAGEQEDSGADPTYIDHVPVTWQDLLAAKATMFPL